MNSFSLPYRYKHSAFDWVSIFIIVILCTPLVYLGIKVDHLIYALPALLLITILSTSLWLYNSYGIVIRKEDICLFKSKNDNYSNIKYSEIEFIHFNNGINRRAERLKIVLKNKSYSVPIDKRKFDIKGIGKFLTNKNVKLTGDF